MIVLSILLTLFACAPPPDVEETSNDETSPSAVRLLPDEPARLTSASFGAPQEVFRWNTDAAALDAWRARPKETLTVEDQDLVLATPLRWAQIERDLDLDAAAIDDVEVVVGESTLRRLSLRWTRDDGTKADLRAIARAEPGGVRRIRFRLSEHPEWKGRIRTIALGDRYGPLRIRTVRGLRYAAEETAAIDETPWKIQIGQELRSAKIARPGRSITQSVSVPEGAVLAFGWGAQIHAAETRFRVLVESADEKPQVVFDELETPRPNRSWRDARVSLKQWANRDVVLRFEVETTDAQEASPRPGRIAAWAHPEVFSPQSEIERPNVLWISIDMWRADRLALYGAERETSPRLGAWAQNATVFDNAIAQAPWTLPSHTSMLTGIDALRHGVNHPTPVPDALKLLGEYLRPLGYFTAGVTGGGFLGTDYGLHQGSDRWDSWAKSGDAKGDLNHFTEGVREFLRAEQDRPFALFAHTYAAHFPYVARQPHFARLAGEHLSDQYEFEGSLGVESRALDARRIRDDGRDFTWPADVEPDPELARILYDAAALAIDDALGEILDDLDRLDLASRTIVVITSDHGIALGEDGYAGHGYLDEANLRVPLLIAVPENLRKETVARVERQVRSIDLLPTVLDLLGVVSESPLDGVSLASLMQGERDTDRRPAWSYAANNNNGLSLRIDNRWKYRLSNAAWSPIQGEEQLISLGSSDDSPEIDALRGRSQQRLMEDAAGFFVALHNRTLEDFRGRLLGDSVQIDKVKSPDAAHGFVRWRAPGEADVELPAGASLTLRFEGAVGAIGLQGDLGDAALPALEIPLAAELQRRRWSFDGEAVVSLGDDVAGFEVHAFSRGPSSADSEIDDELRRQLEALGYL